MVMSYSPTNGNVIQPYQWRLVIQPYQWQCHTALRMAMPCSPTNAWRKCTPIKLVLAGILGHHPINKAVLSMLLQMRHHHLLDVGQPLFLCAAQVGLSEEAKDLGLPVLMLLLLQTHRACRRATFEPHQTVQLLLNLVSSVRPAAPLLGRQLLQCRMQPLPTAHVCDLPHWAING